VNSDASLDRCQYERQWRYSGLRLGSASLTRSSCISARTGRRRHPLGVDDGRLLPPRPPSAREFVVVKRQSVDLRHGGSPTSTPTTACLGRRQFRVVRTMPACPPLSSPFAQPQRRSGSIAAELVLSERTVETHVCSILAKLNLSNRCEIAAWALRQVPAPSGNNNR
jgi:Bacterial regulatory proteins, luxR family